MALAQNNPNAKEPYLGAFPGTLQGCVLNSALEEQEPGSTRGWKEAAGAGPWASVSAQDAVNRQKGLVSILE